MKLRKLSKYYKTLELPEDASLAEITRSYRDLVELYSKPSIAAQAISGGMLIEDSGEILEQLDEAFAELKKHFHLIKLHNEKKIETIVSKVGLFDGHVLKRIRETLNIDLLDIAITTNIQVKHLKNIEGGKFQELPKDVYLRGYLQSYATFMSLDPKRVLDDYMQGYKSWRSKVRPHRIQSLSSY